MIFRRDPCGFVCIFMTYASVLYADYVIVRWIILQTMSHTLWGACNALLFNAVVFLLLMAHTRAVFSDPGIVPLPQNRVDFSDAHSSSAKGDDGGEKRAGATTEEELMALQPEVEEDWTICTRCEMYRPPRAHHCRICKRCIRRMDHHCPWINNCVGEWNQKYFIQFLFYVGVLSGYSILLVSVSWYSYSPPLPASFSHPVHSNSALVSAEMHLRQTRILHSVLLIMESVLFGMFVIAIGCDQFEAIFADETLVEQAVSKRSSNGSSGGSKLYRPRKPKMALLAEVCGRGHPLTWLLPCQSVPLHMAHQSRNFEV